ncbi:MAG: ABC transporter substrate-binding protein [Turicibacter sp.]|nr:ABC transporter substrate-binding protein [Turicibacter sp.]
MKKNKLWLLVATFAAAFLFLAACGDSDDNGADDYDNGDDTTADEVEDNEDAGELEGTITVSWWGNEGRHDATNEVIDLFVSENPGVTINPHYGAWDGWQTAFAGDLEAGQEADLMQVNFNWLQLYSPFGTTFADLEDPAIAAHLDLSNWDSQYIDVTRQSGVVQGVPVGMTARVPFMRADIYEAAGLDVQDINTWDDLIAAGNAIQEHHGDSVFALSPLGPQSMAYMVFSWLEQYTGRSFVDADGQLNYSLEELTDGFQLIQDFIDNGVMPDGAFDSDPINAENPMWIEGAYGGVSEWDSSINAWINNLGEGGEDLVEIRPHFTMDGAQLSGWMSRPSMVFSISNNSDYPEVAAAFLNFMLTDERAIEIMGTDRGVPLNTVGRAYFDALGLGGHVVAANAIHAEAETTTMNAIFEFPEVREVYESQLMEIFNGTSTVEAAAEFVYNNIQAVIDSLLD